MIRRVRVSITAKKTEVSFMTFIMMLVLLFLSRSVLAGEFQESAGVLSMEAENGTVGSRWTIGTDAGASNDAYIEIDPAYNCTDSSPCCTTAECLVTYDFNISTSGNYRFWFRIYTNSADPWNDDSFFWRVDSGSWVPPENNRNDFGAWYSTDRMEVDTLSTGTHVLEISYRENGTRLDKFVIQLDSLTAPSGDGPDESEQSPLDTTKATHPNPSNGAKNVSVSASLFWDAPTAYTPTSYDVYFGTEDDAHNNPKYTVYTNSFDPEGELEMGMPYHWAVDCNDAGTIHTGDPWSFTTFSPRDRVIGNMMLINDNGGWCWYQDDKIIYDPVGGNILTSTAAEGHGFGGIGGSRLNDMDATTFNIATGKRTRVVAREGGGGDDHNMGAFWIDPDGMYLHMYCMHYNDQDTFYRISTNPYDGSSWGSEKVYNWEAIPGPTRPADTYTSSYTNVHYVPSEDRLYNIIRVFERTPCISYSDDWGRTWNFMGRLNGITGTTTYSNFYHKFRVHGNKIHFIGCEQHPRNYTNSIYHGYIQNGISYDSYGNQVDVINDMDAPAIGAFTTVWATGSVAEGEYHTGWTNEIELDENGYPVCLFQTRYGTELYGGDPGAADHRFFYGRFDGSSWTCTELAKMGSGLHTPEEDYIGMGCIHPDDVNQIYISTPFDPRDDSPLEHHEIFKGVTSDLGATWDWTQITINSTEDNIRPAIPQWDANNTAVFWTRGEYPYTEDYDFVVVGMVEQHDVTLGPVNYIDANEINTEESDGSAFTPTEASGSAGAADNQWHEYTGYGNGGSCYTAGDGGTENAPTIRTTVDGLSEGTYNVFAYFWCDPDQDWGVRGSFESSDMLCFNKQSSQHAETSQFSGSVEVINDTFLLYRVYIGRQEVNGGGSITVYIDNYDGSYSGDVPTRTTYDGIGIAPVLTGPVYNPGDLNHDGKVDLIDITMLSQGWQTIYNISTLLDVAENWLFGI